VRLEVGAAGLGVLEGLQVLAVALLLAVERGGLPRAGYAAHDVTGGGGGGGVVGGG
jgi:hypothetical protein